jgi:hypothetical protein
VQAVGLIRGALQSRAGVDAAGDAGAFGTIAGGALGPSETRFVEGRIFYLSPFASESHICERTRLGAIHWV